MGEQHQNGQTRQLPPGKGKMGTERFPKQAKRNTNRRIPSLPQDVDFGWVAKRQQAIVGISFALIWRQLSFKDSLMVWIVMWCVNCHQRQVIHCILQQDWRNLQTAWTMLLDAGGTIWTRHCVFMAWFNASRCCYVLHLIQTYKRNLNNTCSTQGHGTNDITLEWRVRSEGDATFDKMLDRIGGSPATGKSVAGILNIFVDIIFWNRWNRNGAPCPSQTQKGFENWFRKLEWCALHRTKNSLDEGPFIRTKHWGESRIGGWRIGGDPNRKEHERRSALYPCNAYQVQKPCGTDNLVAKGHSFSVATSFFRCASKAASPTLGNVKSSQTVELLFWRLIGRLKIVGFLDAVNRNDEDGSSQRGMTVFCRRKERSLKDGMSCGSLIDHESQKSKKTRLSTTVAELYAFIKCFGSCQFLRGLCMDISGEDAGMHVRTNAKKLVTTARTIHLPQQKATIHMISMLRKDTCSGSFRDLAHMPTQNCWAICLTMASTKEDNSVTANNNREIVKCSNSSKLQDTHEAQGFLGNTV